MNDIDSNLDQASARLTDYFQLRNFFLHTLYFLHLLGMLHQITPFRLYGIQSFLLIASGYIGIHIAVSQQII